MQDGAVFERTSCPQSSTAPSDRQDVVRRPRVVLLAYDGLCTFEFGVAVELFGLARPEMGEAWYAFEVASVDEGPIRATGGVRVMVDGGLERLAGAHLIIAPGWRDLEAPPPGHIVEALRRAHGDGARLMSICSGAFLLAATGLLSRRRATTHWRYADQLARMYPDITVDPSVLYVDEGDTLTSAGSAAGIDLGLHVIRKDYGHRAANLVARRLVAPAHREGGQLQFIDRPVPRADEGERLGPLFDRMRMRLAQRQPIPMLAAEVGMSERTFLRRFFQASGSTPSEWLLRERLSEARSMLETTTRTMDDIATCCGLGTAENLRTHFRRRFGCSPAAYRGLFRAPNAQAAEGRQRR